jgi:toxin ParE1/3/4
MIYKVNITAKARSDMKLIYEYISLVLLSPQSAARQLSSLKRSIMSLDEMPMRCQRYDGEPWKSAGMRVMKVDNYLVFYIPNEETGVVDIMRVIYGGRNINEELRK